MNRGESTLREEGTDERKRLGARDVLLSSFPSRGLNYSVCYFFYHEHVCSITFNLHALKYFFGIVESFLPEVFF